MWQYHDHYYTTASSYTLFASTALTVTMCDYVTVTFLALDSELLIVPKPAGGASL
jgi:hypothetical protein